MQGSVARQARAVPLTPIQANIASMSAGGPPPLTYRNAGVDIDRGNRLVDRIKPLAARTHRDGVLAGVGGFGALFELPLDRYRRPVLVSGTDGVGTKLRLAIETGIHDTVGIDLVAMCANDVLTLGAEPLFFLDYYATGRLDEDVAAAVVAGIARGCELAGAALIGGETAEMPGMYAAGDYDLAGFCVGVVEHDAIVDGREVGAGDVLLGLPSSGAHSNGYSLVRAALARTGAQLDAPFDGRTLGQALLEPTRIYAGAVAAALDTGAVRAMVHVTGGGLTENLPRVLPAGLGAEIETRAWRQPAVFDWLREATRVEPDEMLRTFNCGIGFVLCVPPERVDVVCTSLEASGERPVAIGRVVRLEGNEPPVRYG
jgi:phosphoribosylformylglycinamidine cyclo-ligase